MRLCQNNKNSKELNDAINNYLFIMRGILNDTTQAHKINRNLSSLQRLHGFSDFL